MTTNFHEDPQQYAGEHGLDICEKCGALYDATPHDIDHGHDCAQP